MTPRRTKSHTHEETGITVTMTVLTNGELDELSDIAIDFADEDIEDAISPNDFLREFVHSITDAEGNSIDFDDLDGDITQEAFTAIMSPPKREEKKDSPNGSRPSRKIRRQKSRKS